MIAGTLEIQLLANMARLQQDMDVAKRSVGGAMASIESAVGAAKTALIGLASVGSALKFVEMIRGAIDVADNLNDLSKTTKIAVADLAGLKLAAKQSGGDLDGIAASISKLSVAMGKDPERFAKLGVSAKAPLEAFKQFADVFSAIQDPQLRAALGAEALGKSWASAAPLLSEGGKSIGDMVAKGAALSKVTQDMADNADAFNDKLAELEAATAGAKMKLAGEMLPALVDIAKAITEAYTESGKLQAAWVALGAVGAFAFTNEFSSAAVKIKDLEFLLSGLEKRRTNAGRSIVDTLVYGSVNEQTGKIEDVKAQIKALQDLQNKPAQDAAQKKAEALKALADQKAANEAAAKAAEFLKLNAEALKKANEEQKKQDDLMATLSGLQPDYMEQLTRLQAIRAKGNVGDAQYVVLLTELINKQPMVIAQAKEKAEFEKQRLAAIGASASAELEQADALAESLKQQLEENQAIGATVPQLQALEQAKLGVALATAEQRLQEAIGNKAAGEVLTGITLQVEGLRALIKAKQTAYALQAEADTNPARASLQDVAAYLDPAKAQSFGDALKAALGGANDSMVALGNSFSDYYRQNEELAKLQKALAGDKNLSSEKRIKLETELAAKQSEMQISAYADMAGAAKGMFEKNSDGYKLMQGAETALHLVQMANLAEKLYTSLFVSTATATGVVAGQAVETGAVVAGQATQNAAKVPGVFMSFMSALGPYGAIAAAVAVAAVLGGVGGGGGSVPIPTQAEVDQANRNEGKGTVLGDSSAKSESIVNSLSALESMAKPELQYISQMVSLLHSINSNLSGTTNALLRSGLDTSMSGKTIASSQTSGGGFLANALLGGEGGSFAGKLIGALGLTNAFFGGSKTTTVAGDTGIQLGAGSVNQFIANPNARAYQDITAITDHKDMFGLNPTTTGVTTRNYLGADPDLNANLSRAAASLLQLATSAGQVLGASAANIAGAGAMDTGVTDLKLSGLKPDEQLAKLQAVFSGLGDRVAKEIMPGLDAFQKGGEGYLETLTRVAGGVEYAAMVTERLGTSTVALSALENKQGDVAAELVRQSIAGAEALSGVGDIIQTFSGSADDIAGLYTGLVDVRTQLVAIGFSADVVSKNLLLGAGGLDALTGGLKDFQDGFLSEAEQFKVKQASMDAQFSKLGMATPATADAFKQLVLGLQSGGAASAAMLGHVLSLAAGMRDLADSNPVEKLTQAVRDAQSNLRSALRGIGDVVQAFATTAASAAASVADVQSRISQGYFTAQDAVTAAQQKVNDITRQAADNTLKFTDSIASFLGTISPLTSSGASLASLKAQFSNTSVLAQGGDATSQSQLIAQAQAVLKAAEASSTSRVDYARTEAFVRNTLGGVQQALTPVTGAGAATAITPLAQAQQDLAKAQIELTKYAALAAATGSSTDRNTAATASATQSLLTEFMAAQTTNAKAQADYKAALTLTGNLALTQTTSLDGLLSNLADLGAAQADVATTTAALAASTGAASAAGVDLGVSLTDLDTALGLTGDAAAAFNAQLDGLGLSAADFANFFDATGLSSTQFKSAMDATGLSLQDFIATLADKSQFTSLTDLDTALGLSGSSATQFNDDLAATGVTATEFKRLLDATGLSANELVSALQTTSTNASVGFDNLTTQMGLSEAQALTLGTALGNSGLSADGFTAILDQTGASALSLVQALTGTDSGADGSLLVATRLSAAQLNTFRGTLQMLGIMGDGLTNALGQTAASAVALASTFSQPMTSAMALADNLGQAGLAAAGFASLMSQLGVVAAAGGTGGTGGASAPGVPGIPGSAFDPSTPIRNDYMTLFGREAEPAGVAYWLSTGLTGDALFQAIRAGAQGNDIALERMRGFAVGTNYVQSDGPAYLHKGEQVKSQPYVDMERRAREESNALMRQLVGQIEALTDEVETLRKSSQKIEKNTGDTKKLVNTNTQGGRPLADASFLS